MSRTLRLSAVALALVSGILFTGCAPISTTEVVVAAPETGTVWPEIIAYPGVRVIDDVRYGFAGGFDLRADVCLPPEPSVDTVAGDGASDGAAVASAEGTVNSRAAVLLVHGGSWARGDKAEPHWRNLCEWLASENFVGVSVNYRVAPRSPFPAAIDDVTAALRWLREPAQTERFQIDPARIGALGGSAGANLVALLGTTGSGSLNAGDRVSAVAALSPPVDLTEAGRLLGGLTPTFEQVQLDYLNCESLARCPAARRASPLYHIDSADPPFYVAHSTSELIPLEQATAFVDALRASGIDAEFDVLDGARHSIGVLDATVYTRMAEFLHRTLDDTAPAA